MSTPATSRKGAKHENPLGRLNPYLVGFLGIALATALRLPLEGLFKGCAPYALYFLLILYIVWRADIGPTIATTVLAFITGWYCFIPPSYSFIRDAPEESASLVLNVVAASAMIILSRKAAQLRATAVRNEEACRRAERGARAAVWDWDPQTGTYETAVLGSLFGIEDCKGCISDEKIEAIVHPEDRALYRQALARAHEKHEPFRAEFRIQHPKLGPRWLAATGELLSKSRGGRWVSGVTIDVTDRKLAEAAAAHQREWFQVTLRSIGDAVIASDREGHVTFMNPVAETLTGWTVAEALGRPLAEVFHIINEKTREPVENPADKVMRVGVVIGLANHTALISRDGQERPIADSAAPIQGEDGVVLGVILVFHDVSAERHAADAVAEQREWFQRTLESIGDGVIASDVRGRIVFMNPVAEYLTGCRLDEVSGHDCADVFRIVNETTRATVESPVGRVLREGSIVGLANHTTLISSSGVARPIDDSGAPIRSRDGRIVGVVLVFRDVSERRTAEIEKQAIVYERERLLESERAARSEAQRATRLKDEFVATLSHELRTPLNVIFGWVHVLKSGATDANTLQQAIDVIDRAARTQAQLVSDLLDMSRILSGKMHLDVRSIEITAVIDAALETVKPAADAKQIEIERRLEPVPPVVADPSRLQQVVWNLVSNAVKFTPKGGRVTVVVRRVDELAEVAIIDSGIGIRPEFLEHVFERFRQGDGSATRQFGGLGLGLSIVKQLVELHGGSVTVESQGEGRGATFRVKLPIGSGRAGPVPIAGADDLHKRIEAVARERLKELRILVVEDERDTMEFIVRLLQECGASVSEASSGAEALLLLNATRPDVIVCDIGMPGMDGYTLIQRIRSSADPRVARVPAIALTAFARPEDRTRALRAGYQAHLVKPMDPAELIATLASFANLIGRGGAADRSSRQNPEEGTH